MKTPYAETPQVANAYLRRERDRRRRRELAWVIAVVVPLGLALLGYTWVRLQILSTGYRISELELELAKTVRLESHLRLEAAAKSRLDEVETIARQRLGLVDQSLVQTVYYDELALDGRASERRARE